MNPQQQKEFRAELTALINKASAENDSNTPDYILADLMISCLNAANALTRAREKFYDVKLYPGHVHGPGVEIVTSDPNMEDRPVIPEAYDGDKINWRHQDEYGQYQRPTHDAIQDAINVIKKVQDAEIPITHLAGNIPMAVSELIHQMSDEDKKECARYIKEVEPTFCNL
jgi:hypothetical protein